jgi:hypothetical protein
MNLKLNFSIGWVDGWMDESQIGFFYWMDEWMDGCIPLGERMHYCYVMSITT